MDEVTKLIQQKVPWCMLFANDIVLVNETTSGVNVELKIQRNALECFRLSRIKIDNIECKFSKSRNKDEGVGRLDAQEIQKMRELLIYWIINP